MQKRKLVGVLLCGFGALLSASALPELVFEKYQTSAQRLFPCGHSYWRSALARFLS